MPDAAVETIVPTPAPALHDRKGWVELWFLLDEPVGRKAYALTGIGLMAVKYGVEAAVIGVVQGRFYSPLDFVNPVLSAREQFVHSHPVLFGLAWMLWSLPFLWIATSMSVRRALDARLSPWIGLWILVPLANFVTMIVLACLPTRLPATYWKETTESEEMPRSRAARHWTSAVAMTCGVAAGALYAAVVATFCLFLLKEFGAILFFGTPFITGAAAGFGLNQRTEASVAATIGVATAAMVFAGTAILLFGMEGFICLAMAVPIAVPLSIVGGLIGKFMAGQGREVHGGMLGCLLLLPLLGVFETQLPVSQELLVTSAVEIAASPTVVWQQVIAFPEISEQPEWFFRLGIACPVGARIEGEGVGATRRCIFSTGEFIEPITVWQPPRQLAFDVREQPEPLFELTPYRNLHPPHLKGAFRSTRGEFELVPLASGGTRLVGRTWYTLDIRPINYWSVWTDWLIHRIHLRVLRHIERLAEADPGPGYAGGSPAGDDDAGR